MKYIITITAVMLFQWIASPVFSQKTVSGESHSVRLVENEDYPRSNPPDLELTGEFTDDNNNQILEALESATLNLKITNMGKGPAQGVIITLRDNNYDPELVFDSIMKFSYILDSSNVQATFKFKAGKNIKTMEHKIDIYVTEHSGYDLIPGSLTLNAIEFREPELVFSNLEIIDNGPNTYGKPADGLLQMGEKAYIKIYIRNVGQNISPKTKYKLVSRDVANIYLENTSGDLGDISKGEYTSFKVLVSLNNRVKVQGALPLFLSLTNDFQRGELSDFQLPLELGQKPAKRVEIEVSPDYEKLNQLVSQLDPPSKKITGNIANFIDINIVPQSVTKRPNSIGIVIGVENYDDFVSAPYAKNDAMIMTKYFNDVLGLGKVMTYTDKEVVGYFFFNRFDPFKGDLRNAIDKGNTDVFIYYSGHGAPSKNGEKAYLLPFDAMHNAIEVQGYDLDKLYQNLDSLGARSVTVFLDACFSGASRATEIHKSENLMALKGVKIAPQVTQPWNTNSHFTVFTSSAYDETSLGFDESEHGLFTYYLCTGLGGKADLNSDNKITMNELKDYVISNVKMQSDKTIGLQTPQFYGDGSIVLVEY